MVSRDDWFRAILASGPGADDRVVVDLGYDYRENPPVTIEGIGPVLDVEDIVTGKVRAFVDRSVERDYSDIGSILDTGQWTIHDLFAKAQSIFPALTKAEFADRLGRADRLDPAEYAAIGIGPRDVAGLASRLSAAAHQLLDQ